ncbi:hypothetical protein JOL79_06880 [Microbispora sp. RL4-1S]|uniref:Uncharacterized protein n=1 Tax=Microbispora oryzae TaxID=2806554 RepID=A0A940WHX3_9ACTN|nr:hypothetical protein [Microbispora oryzae]MBP2703522.1 hypothetical protein [Microbispora oryzae]
MPATCWSSIGGEVMRATRLDACGAPVIGPCSTVVSDGFVSIAWESEIKEGTDIEVLKANGQLCVSDKQCDELKWINLTISFCQVNPDLFSMLTGYETVLDYSGAGVGNRIGQEILCNGGVALETWTKIPGQACSTTANAARPWGYFLAPWIKSAILNSFTLENDAATFEITARTEKGSGWGTGPYDVVATDATNTAGPLLTPIGAKDHLHMQLTTVQPPTVDEDNCGCVPLAA